MEIKLMLDEDVQLSLARALRTRGYDAVHVREIGRRGFDDSEQLEYAIANGRCIFTFNVGDFVELHKAWSDDQREHGGIIVSQQRSVGECLRRLMVQLQINTAETIRNELLFL
jgi:uncharacterized protein with PIN domain